jgi:hypothetical protein
MAAIAVLLVLVGETRYQVSRISEDRADLRRLQDVVSVHSVDIASHEARLRDIEEDFSAQEWGAVKATVHRLDGLAHAH